MARADKSSKKISPEQIEELRKVLVEKRNELIGTVDDLTHDVEGQLQPGNIGGGLSNLPTHPADQGTDLFMRDLDLDLLGRERDQLGEIDAALKRMAEGTYGICEETGQPIGIARLRAQPWARLSLEAAKRRESL